ncbi:fructosamine-3-kinase [Thioalkalivibrio sp. ALE21]|uniref:fructosamine kinase family protein n=1 Tax=Thioalkalivibrio sp. ALE21 TaxID=1158175 RepID=UPI000D9BF642|nr:fructosamine kinase family protein [Thioalkalivibrio sp. ALE21]PYG01503.1 fructosamine-3-kinase [Thioalkalivibrio sp. ALE21]
MTRSSARDDDLTAALARCITDHTGVPFEATGRSARSGGSINQALRLEGTDGRRFFVKLNRGDHAGMFAAEARGLTELQRCEVLKIPAVIGTGEAAGARFLIIEDLDLGGPRDAVALAWGIADMHSHTASRFGLDEDNFIGSTPQSNRPHADWVDFYREERLGFQRRLARDRGAPRGRLDTLAELEERLDGFFTDYRPQPSLLHGDLWSGNWDFLGDGRPTLFDPATYYGDPEADLAMMELFGHPGKDFFAAYAEQRPLDPGYATRRTLYNLYHILNHDHLFGGGYGSQAERMAQQLLAEVR